MNYLSQQHICDSIGSVHDPTTEYLEIEVLDIFNNGNLEKYKKTTDPKLMTWIATYCEHILKNNFISICFLKKAVDLGDQNAINNLACHYFVCGFLDQAEQLWKMCDQQNELIQKNLQSLARIKANLENYV